MNEINDQFILNYFYRGHGKPSNNLNSNLLKEIPENIKQYLINRYKDSDSIKETINRIKYQIEERPTCKYCGGHVKYKSLDKFALHCSLKCSANDKNTRDKCKETCLEKYGVINGGASKQAQEKIKNTCLKHFGVTSALADKTIQNKAKQTCLEKYGNIYYFKTDDYKKKCKETCLQKYGTLYSQQNENIKEKIKAAKLLKYGNVNYVNIEKARETCLKKYGVPFWNQSTEGKEKQSKIAKSKKRLETYKKTCLEKYGVDFYSKTDEFNMKRFTTMFKNNNCGYNKSKQEDQVYELLLNKFNEVKRYYCNILYPWQCDFYIPSLNLYIEYNGHWTHGGMPFDNNNIICIEKLQQWQEKAKNSKYYKNAINTWTIYDVKKRNIAKKNNLNYIEFWNISSVKKWIFDYESKNN